MNTLYFVFLTASATCLLAADSNKIYVTDDGGFYSYHSGHGKWGDAKMIEAAKTNRECQSSGVFSEGNWGPIESGFQLSLRFEKTIFTNGEPINAIVLIRNVTNENAYLHYSPIRVGYHGAVGFKIMPASRQPILLEHHVPIPDQLGVDANYRWLAPGTQHKYQERLDQRFDLTNGTYLIQAVKVALCDGSLKFQTNGFSGDLPLVTPSFDEKLRKEVEVKSSNVKITISN